jgi:hypothetical protein
VDGSDGLHNCRVATKYYRRILGEAQPRETFSGRDSRWRGNKMPRPGVQDDQAANRVKDMDDEGADVHFLIRGSWMSLAGLPGPSFEANIVTAAHRRLTAGGISLMQEAQLNERLIQSPLALYPTRLSHTTRRIA